MTAFIHFSLATFDGTEQGNTSDKAYGIRADQPDSGHRQRLGQPAQGRRLQTGDADHETQYRVLPLAFEADERLQSVLRRPDQAG